MGSFEKWERIKGFYNTKSCLLVVSNGSGVGIIEIENKIFHGQVNWEARFVNVTGDQ